MKDLTVEEFEKAPTIVQVIIMSGMTGHPIGLNTYQQAMSDHPEYFEDELEYQRKYKLIPDEVHDAYNTELISEMNRIKSVLPPSLGILGWSKHPEKLDEFNKEWMKIKPDLDKMEDDLFVKYYGLYGLVKNKKQ